jgi:hypothetical protein
MGKLVAGQAGGGKKAFFGSISILIKKERGKVGKNSEICRFFQFQRKGHRGEICFV